MLNRPKRRENVHLCWQVLHGADAEGLLSPVGNGKPHRWYW